MKKKSEKNNGGDSRGKKHHGFKKGRRNAAGQKEGKSVKEGLRGKKNGEERY